MRRHALKKGRDEGTPWGRDLTRGHALKEGRDRGHDLVTRGHAVLLAAAGRPVLRFCCEDSARAQPAQRLRLSTCRLRGGDGEHERLTSTMPTICPGEKPRGRLRRCSISASESFASLRLQRTADLRTGALQLFRSKSLPKQVGRIGPWLSAHVQQDLALVASKDVRVSRFDCFVAFHRQRREWL